MEELQIKIREWVATKVFDENWVWLAFLISVLCDIEMAIPLFTNPERYHKINTASIIRVSPQRETESYAQQVIPKETMYCQGCPFYATSEVAEFFYGYQCDGYCYYLGKGDFSFVRPTDLLWDGCKCCGINDDLPELLEDIPTGSGFGDNL